MGFYLMATHFLLLVAMSHAESLNGTCNGCQCSGKDWALDFTGVAFPFNISDTEIAKFYYIVDLCHPFQCSSINSVVCQYGANDPDHHKPHPYSCGTPSTGSFTITNKSPLQYTITYSGGEGNRNSILNFAVASSPSIALGSGRTYTFNINQPNVGKLVKSSTDSAAGPIGISLICLALVAVAAYFIIGALVMYFLKGARGVEVVPNWSFWKQAPSLFKDGVLFTFGPCIKRIRKQSDYEQI